MNSPTGSKTIEYIYIYIYIYIYMDVYIFINISRRKENQTKKFDQLIKYNTTNTFSEKLQTKFDGEISPDLFLNNQNSA